MTFFDCTADLVGQLNGDGQKGMLQTDAPLVENFWLRHSAGLHANRLLDRSNVGWVRTVTQSLRSRDAATLLGEVRT